MNKILKSVLGLLTATATGLPIHAAEHAPKLVIGIHIDQLDANYLDWFKSGFSEGGLRKILQSGTQYKNVVFASAKPDAAVASASFMTGATPREHGITGSTWYDPSTAKMVSSIFDPNYLGNYTQQTVSPKNLMGSTLVDELKKASKNQSHIFAIGIDAEKTILLGGHSANGVFWLDDRSGKWCTSTYFNYMPLWLQGINDRNELENEVDGSTWIPLKALSNYQNLPFQEGASFFNYTYDKPTNAKFRKFKHSPLVNGSVIRIANEVVEQEQLGKDNSTDYLIVQLSAAHTQTDTESNSTEIQDIYYRLDEDIAKLLREVEKVAGKDYQVYITGLGQEKLPTVETNLGKTYTGDFYPQRCTSLLNLYLMAIYGNEPWVSAWDNQKIFLNHKKIEEKGLNIGDIRRKAATFLAEFSGVTEVFTYDQLLIETSNEVLKQKAYSIRPERAADLFVELQGGWNVREEAQTNQYQVGRSFFSIPFILYAPDQKAQVISTPTAVGDITASLARIFRIRPPNDCRGIALPSME